MTHRSRQIGPASNRIFRQPCEGQIRPVQTPVQPGKTHLTLEGIFLLRALLVNCLGQWTDQGGDGPGWNIAREWPLTEVLDEFIFRVGGQR